MLAIAPALICIACLVDPHPDASSEAVASVMFVISTVTWVLEGIFRLVDALDASL